MGPIADAPLVGAAAEPAQGARVRQEVCAIGLAGANSATYARRPPYAGSSREGNSRRQIYRFNDVFRRASSFAAAFRNA